MNKTAFRGLFILVLGGALAFRLPGLTLRPMHHDEANQAVKFGRLLEEGAYRYDKSDHHGPSLYYLSLPLAKAFGKSTLASLDETTLRLLPALFGAGIVLLLALFLPDLGKSAVLFGGALFAFSPAMAYYSRFYIQEMIFAFFTVGWLASTWRYGRRPSAAWAVAAGFFAGMMFATKETSVIVFAAGLAAYALTQPAQKRTRADEGAAPKARMAYAALGLAMAALTAALFFSSFFSHPRGIVDSVAAFGAYFVKAGASGFHIHPPLYYLRLLTFSNSGGLVWSEALVLALAFLGILGGLLRRRTLVLFLAAYAVLAALVFSLIPYKTPWNLLPFYAGFVVLAGFGAAFLFEFTRRKSWKITAAVLLAAGFIHLGWQSAEANFNYQADPRNPWVYAQTSPDFLKLIKRIDGIAAVSPQGKSLLIKVISDPYETWPLPWYLRAYGQVGYWTDWKTAGGLENVPFVVASSEQAAKIAALLESTHQPEYFGLRPDVLLELFVRKDVWETYLATRK